MFWSGRYAISNDDGGYHWVDTATNETRLLHGQFAGPPTFVIAPDGLSYAATEVLRPGDPCFGGGTYAVIVRDLDGNVLEQQNDTFLYEGSDLLWTAGPEAGTVTARNWDGTVQATNSFPTNMTRGRPHPHGPDMAWQAADGIHVRYGTEERLVFGGAFSDPMLVWSAVGTLAIAQRGGNSTAPSWNLTVVDTEGNIDWHAQGEGHLRHLLALGDGWIIRAGWAVSLATEQEGVRPLNLTKSGQGFVLGGDGATVVVLYQTSTYETTTNADGSVHIDMGAGGPSVNIVGHRVLRTIADAEAYTPQDESRATPSLGLVLWVAGIVAVGIRRRLPVTR